METKQSAPSVIAKLMGLEELPPQYPARKRQRVFSEKYLQKVASVGVREKQSFHQHYSSGMRIEEKRERKGVIEVAETSNRDNNESSSYPEEAMVTVGGQRLSDTERIALYKKLEDLMEFYDSMEASHRKEDPLVKHPQEPKTLFSKHLQDWQDHIHYLQSQNVGSQKSCTSYIRNMKGCRNTRMETGEGQYDKLFWKINHGFKRNNQGELGLQNIYRFSRSQKESVNGPSFPSRNVLLTKNTGKSANSVRCLSLHGSCEGSIMGDQVFKEDSNHKSGSIYPIETSRRKLACHAESVIQWTEVSACISGEVSGQRVHDAVTPSELLAASSKETGRRCTDNQIHKNGLNDQSNSSGIDINKSIRGKDYIKVGNARKIPISGFGSASSDSIFYQKTNNYNGILHKAEGLGFEKSLNYELYKSRKHNNNNKKYGPDNCINEEKMEENKLEESAMPENTIFCSNALFDGVRAVSAVTSLGDDTVTDVEGRPSENNKGLSSEDAEEDYDSSTHITETSFEQETSIGFHEGSLCSLCPSAESDSIVNLEMAYQPSPISVLEPPFREEILSHLGCLKVRAIDEYDSSETDPEEPGMNVSSDEDSSNVSEGDYAENQDSMDHFSVVESRDFSYVVEVLTDSGLNNRNFNTDFGGWYSSECPINPSVFETLEKKFGEHSSWKRSERKLLFERINAGLIEVLLPCMGVLLWEKPVVRRLKLPRPSQEMIEEELWALLAVQGKEAGKDSIEKLIEMEFKEPELGQNIDDIVKEIVNLLIEDLAAEIFSLESFENWCSFLLQ